jgi:hypothetical protein
MRAKLAGVMVVVVAGCATREPPPTTRGPVEDVVTITGADGTVGGEVRVTRDSYVASDVVAAPIDAVWQALPAAYSSVGLGLPRLDRAQGVAVLDRHRLSRRLGGERLSRYFDCGRGMAGPYADTYRIHLAVTTEVRPAQGDTTRVLTRLDAQGESTSGTANNVQCRSEGRLESLITEALRSAVGG